MISTKPGYISSSGLFFNFTCSYRRTTSVKMSSLGSKMSTSKLIYKDPNAPIEERIKDLLSQMTLKEKIGQMTQIERSVATPSAITDLSIGNLSFFLVLQVLV